MNEIKINNSSKEGRIIVQAPYSKRLLEGGLVGQPGNFKQVRGIKDLQGAKWNGKFWSVEASEMQAVVNLVDYAYDFYSVSGLVNVEKLEEVAKIGGFNEELDGEKLAAWIS
jgi:hypothetical protein